MAVLSADDRKEAHHQHCDPADRVDRQDYACQQSHHPHEQGKQLQDRSHVLTVSQLDRLFKTLKVTTAEQPMASAFNHLSASSLFTA